MGAAGSRQRREWTSCSCSAGWALALAFLLLVASALAGFPVSQLAKGQFCRTLSGGDSWTVYGAGTPYSVCAPGRATQLLRASIPLHLPNVEKSGTHAASLEGSWGQSKGSHTQTSQSTHTTGSEHLPHRVRGQSRQACECVPGLLGSGQIQSPNWCYSRQR